MQNVYKINSVRNTHFTSFYKTYSLDFKYFKHKAKVVFTFHTSFEYYKTKQNILKIG